MLERNTLPFAGTGIFFVGFVELDQLGREKRNRAETLFRNLHRLRQEFNI
jgi:hypothetical protein